MPPVPAPLAELTVPDPFTGCWQGRPDGYDTFYNLQPAFHAGQPGLVTFCSHKHEIDADAYVVVPAKLRALEVALTLGLGYTSFHCHGLQTDVYSVSPTTMRGRTTLAVVRSFRLLYVLPIPLPSQPTKVDWKVTLTGPDALRVEAYQVVYLSDAPSFAGTWHADFTRSAEKEH
jgi:hypothetical protein